MIKSTLIILLRAIQKRFFVFGLNILGLSIGICCVFFIAIYAIDEFSFDQHIKNHEKIFRVVTECLTNSSSDLSMAESFLGVAPTLKREFPEVEEAVRVFPFKGNIIVQYKSGDNKVFNAENTYRVDKEFFKVFDHSFIYGNESGFSRPNSIVVTESLSKKLFGKNSPINKAVLIDNQIYGVVGVIDDLPKNSDLYYEALLSHDFSPYDDDWGNPAGFTYILLHDSGNPNELESRINSVVTEKTFAFFVKEYNIKSTIKISLQPLNTIHFSEQLSGDSIKGNPLYLKVLMTLGVLILIIVIFNHANFSTSFYLERVRELSIKKVMGINKIQLIQQFIYESSIIAGVVILISMILYTSFLPAINLITGKNLCFFSLFEDKALIIVMTVALLIILAGNFYALFYSTKNTAINGLKGFSNLGGNKVRKILIVGQLAFSAGLVFFTITVHNQVDFLKERNIGFSADKIIMVSLPKDVSRENSMTTFVDDLRKNNPINKFSYINELSYPGSERLGYQLGWIINGDRRIEANFNVYEVDSLFTNLLDIRFVAGNKFSSVTNSSVRQAVVNESFLKMAGFKEPENIIGSTIHAFDDKFEVVGVVNDFNYQDFRKSIRPLAMVSISPTSVGNKKILIRLNDKEDLIKIESSYQRLDSQVPFEYSFLDERVDKMFEQEQTTGQVTQIFSLLAILLAGIGLYSLSNLILAQRTKEIGIRKILGITQGSLTMLLSREFFALSSVSLGLSIPFAWYQSQRWLTAYAFRIDIKISTIGFTAMTIVTILIIGIMTNVIRSTKINPVDLLKNE